MKTVARKLDAWPVQDAKARFSEFLERCLTQGPQMVTRRGTEAAVLISAAHWHRLQTQETPSLKELLLSDHARTAALVPARGGLRRRKPEAVG